MNKQRKQKVQLRALAYANTQRMMHYDSDGVNGNGGADSLSWEEGYRAAMRDARKVMKQAPAATTADDCAHVYEIAAIEAFLRPLR